MLKFAIPNGDSLCLSRLLESVEGSSSDFAEGASTVSEAIKMLGVDACLSLNVAGYDLDNGGIQFSLLASAKVFDEADVDWTSFFDSIDNSWFQNFLLLSGSASEAMADEIFDEILNVFGIAEPLTHSFDVGSAVLSLTLSPTPSFVAESGLFQLGSYATGQSILGTMNPTMSPSIAVSTASPSIAVSTASPSVSASSSEFPTSSPTEHIGSTVVFFGVDVTLAGISSEDFDDAAQKAFQQVTANALTGDVSAQAIVIDSHSSSGILVSSRSLRSLSTALLVSFTVENVMETTDFNDPLVMGSTYQQDIEEAFADPATATEWTVSSESFGSSTISSSTIVAFSAPTYTTPISVVIVTTSAPTNAPLKRSNGGAETSETAMIAGVVAGTVVAVALLMIGAAYYRSHIRRQKVAEESIASTPNIVVVRPFELSSA
jgi:hypothetical protein